jgi:hypothetical protein
MSVQKQLESPAYSSFCLCETPEVEFVDEFSNLGIQIANFCPL